MRKIIPVLAAGVTTLAVAGGTYGYVQLNSDVTLSVDGVASALTTRTATVGDLLTSQGIAVGEHDLVAPGLTTELSDGSYVAVKFGREVTFTVDGKPQTVWTTATTVDQAVDALGVNTRGAAFSTSRSSSIGREGLALDIATRKSVTIKADGKKRTLTTTALTVGEALREAKIKVDGNDKTSRATSARLTDGSSITYTDVDVDSVTKKKSIAFDTVRRESKSLTKGVTRTTTAGVVGTRAVTYRVVRHDGDVVRRTQTGSKVLTKPVTQVITVGTKVAAPSSKSSSGGSSSGGSSSGGSGVWDRLAKCESGGNWSINTGNGYYGGLQFSLSTWRAYGGSGMPHKASKATQIAVAEKVQRAQGWGAWPGCTSKLGIR